MKRATMGGVYRAYQERKAREQGRMGAPEGALDAVLEGAPPACLNVDPWSGSFTVRYGGHEAIVEGMLSGSQFFGWVPDDSQGFWDTATKYAWEQTQKYINGLSNAMPMPYIDNGRVAEIVQAAADERWNLTQMVYGFANPRWEPTEEFAFRKGMARLGQLIACGRYAAALSNLVQRYADKGKGDDYPFGLDPKTQLGVGPKAFPPPVSPEDPIIIPDPVVELPGKFTLKPAPPAPPKTPVVDASRFGITVGPGGADTSFDPQEEDKEGPWTGATGETEEKPPYKADAGGMMFLAFLAAAGVGYVVLKK